MDKSEGAIGLINYIIIIIVLILLLNENSKYKSVVDRQNIIIRRQNELLSTVHELDSVAWDDVVTETDAYQNLIEVYNIGF